MVEETDKPGTMALIRIKNLQIRTFIGFNPEELVHKQDVVINMEVEVDLPEAAMENDEPDGIYDYKKITKQVITLVQEGRFKLLEVLTRRILELVMADPMVRRARVQVDKPHALRYADSVSVELEASR